MYGHPDTAGGCEACYEESVAFAQAQRALPNPGSLEARLRGCSCPVVDNHHGKGYRGDPSQFIRSVACTLHGTGTKAPT